MDGGMAYPAPNPPLHVTQDHPQTVKLLPVKRRQYNADNFVIAMNKWSIVVIGLFRLLQL